MCRIALLLSLVVLFFISCSGENPEVVVTITDENCKMLDVYIEFQQENLQDLTGLSERDSINVNFEASDTSVLFTLINHGKKEVYIGKDAGDNAQYWNGGKTPYKIEGTRYDNLSMVTITLQKEQVLKPGEKIPIRVNFPTYGNYLVGFLYHAEDNGQDIMNVRWKYSEIIDLNLNDQN